MRDFMTLWLAGLMVCGAAANAAERTDTVSTFEKLEASRGFDVEVVCGETSSVALSGPSDGVADTKVSVNGKTLKIERKASSLDVSSKDTVRVKVTTIKPLDSLAISTGVDLRAAACAITSDHLDLTASTGANIKTAAKVNRLVIDASTGADIGPLPGQRIDALETKVHASTGADIKLCKAGKLSGSLSLGSDISIESADSRDVSTSLGADVTTRDCH